MTVPCIKGIAFKTVVEDVVHLIDSGRIERQELKQLLTADDLAFLDHPVLESIWYPVESYQRMMKLLRDREGGGDNAYLRARGEKTAQRLIDSGIYQQLRYAERLGETRTREGAVRHLKLIITLWNSMFNVGDWRIYLDENNPRAFGVDIHDADQIPDVAFEAVAGFVDRVVKCDRIPTDDVIYRRIAPGIVRLSIVLLESDED